jgi:hypothetical protein
MFAVSTSAVLTDFIYENGLAKKKFLLFMEFLRQKAGILLLRVELLLCDFSKGHHSAERVINIDI